MDVFSESELKDVKNRITKEILVAFDTHGKESAFSKLKSNYEANIKQLKDKIKEEKDRSKLLTRISSHQKQVKEILVEVDRSDLVTE